jgi:hypothetical protein
LTALTPGEVLLYLPSPVLVLHGRVASYAFVCPACSSLAVGLADRHTITLLQTADVVPLPTLLRCAERSAAAATAGPHPEAPPAGPALTADDLLDFHQLLAGTDAWVARLVAAAALSRSTARHDGPC